MGTIWMGLLALQERDFWGAIEELRRAVEISPETGRFYLSLGKALYARERGNPAAEQMHGAKNPSAEPGADRGVMEEAVGVLGEAVRRDGGLVEAWMLLGGGAGGTGAL